MTVPEVEPVSIGATRASVSRLMVPTDANLMGSVFGGQILSEIDRVAFIAAVRHARAPCVTASFDRVDFIQPIHVGEVVDFDAQITFVGRSSMEVWVPVHAEELAGGGPRLVGEAYLTMVAVDSAGRPTPGPPLTLRSDEERLRFEEGRSRMEERRRTRQSARE